MNTRSDNSGLGPYDIMGAPPGALIDRQGKYPAGWYRQAPGALNLKANRKAGWRRLHRWFFIHFDSPELFVGANVIDLRLGGNVGIVVLDKRTGEFTVAGDTGLLLRNAVQISKDCRAFSDRRTDSFIRISADDRRLEFDLTVGKVSLKGSASALFERPFVQSTPFGGHLGTLQSWGNLTLDAATLTRGGVTTQLPAGLYGAYDRSLGHRRVVENWNWIAACGEATGGADSQAVPFALHAAVDRAEATPQVNGRKFALWVGDRFVKLPDLAFDYTNTGEPRGKTSAWRISSSRTGDDGGGDSEAWVDLTFTPRFHRRDSHNIPFLFRVDHSQYFGELNGEVSVDGEVFALSDVFATTEDSRMAV